MINDTEIISYLLTKYNTTLEEIIEEIKIKNIEPCKIHNYLGNFYNSKCNVCHKDAECKECIQVIQSANQHYHRRTIFSAEFEHVCFKCEQKCLIYVCNECHQYDCSCLHKCGCTC